MRVRSVNPDEPRPDRVDAAVAVLREGGIVALPTETFYGLAGDASNLEAMRRVNALKGKPGAPILLLVDRAESAAALADPLPEGFATLAERFWPGPLTLVVPAPRMPAEVTGGLRTVGVRVPSLALPRRIAEALGGPISGVSANRTGEPPHRVATQLESIFGDELGLLLDGGPTQGAAPSTILDISGEIPRVLREGMIPSHALKSFLPRLAEA